MQLDKFEELPKMTCPYTTTKVRTLFTTLGYIAAGKTPEARSSILVELGTVSGLVHPQHKPDL